MESIIQFRSFNLTSLAFVLALALAGGCSSTDSESGSMGPSNGDLFDSGSLSPGASFSYTFTMNKDTTVNYFCSIHEPDMKGKIVISQGAGGSGQDTVAMQNLQFMPDQLTIAPNTTIVWMNEDDVSHTVINGSPGSGSANTNPGY